MADGEIDYSKFTRGQLLDALVRIDRTRRPVDFANLTRELNGRVRDDPTRSGAIPTDAPFATRLVFTGTGAEYFRIWIVHSLLTVLTLGVYSAWAKVRRERWFAQHTRLAGDPFDYHGRPLRILLGRVIALALVAAYTGAHEWSPTAVLGVVGVLVVLGPALYRAAQRFRLSNTSWRGLRFGFCASTPLVYAVCVPFVLALAALRGSVVWLGSFSTVAALAWPALHASLKSMQHRSACYGGQAFTFEPAIRAFYGLYLRVLVVAVGAGFLAASLAGLISFVKTAVPSAAAAAAVAYLAPIALFYVIVIPYYRARLQQLVWSRTGFGALRFGSSVEPGELRGVLARNLLLTVLTAGLYWPFAAVAIARCQVQSITVESLGPLPEISGQRPASSSSVGDAATDFFGLDLGW